MHIIRTASVLGALGLLLMSQSGCVAVACCAGAGAGIAYVGGASEMMLEGTPQQVGQATEAACAQLGLAVISSRLRDNSAEVIARTQKDDKVTIDISGRGYMSRVSVRVGVFGDRYFQNRMLATISDNLRSSPPEMPVDAQPEAEPMGEAPVPQPEEQ